MARVQVVHSVEIDPDDNGYHLCFQDCRYIYDDGEMQEGKRFIWRDPGGNLLPQRGQARIPAIAMMRQLQGLAIREGWANPGERNPYAHVTNRITELCKRSDPACEVSFLSSRLDGYFRFEAVSPMPKVQLIEPGWDFSVLDFAMRSDEELWQVLENLSSARIRRPVS